jgi:hypothetical protein
MMKFDDLAKRIQELKGEKGADLSMEEDLSIAIMNLISLEEHFFFTAEKTKKSDYFDLLNETREIRKELMARMIDRHEGETWCVSKHLLAATMRIMEVGTKLQSEGKRQEAKDTFDKAYKVYSLFWALRLKLLDLSDVKKKGIKRQEDGKKPMSYEDIVSKLVDCCRE